MRLSRDWIMLELIETMLYEKIVYTEFNNVFFFFLIMVVYFKIQYLEGFKSYFIYIKDSRKFEEYCCGWNKGTKVPIEVEN